MHLPGWAAGSRVSVEFADASDRPVQMAVTKAYQASLIAPATGGGGTAPRATAATFHLGHRPGPDRSFMFSAKGKAKAVRLRCGDLPPPPPPPPPPPVRLVPTPLASSEPAASLALTRALAATPVVIARSCRSITFRLRQAPRAARYVALGASGRGGGGPSVSTPCAAADASGRVTCHVDGLSPVTTYSFSIVAEDAAGMSRSR